MGKQLILSASVGGFGFHPGAARSNPQRLSSLDHYRHLVKTAQRGALDFVLLHDARALAADHGRIDALSILSRLAPETSGVGLAVSKPTTYTEPFTVSRELATLDFVSGGRAGWNATTLGNLAEALNFGESDVVPADVRRSIATEFIEVSRKLWDSWEDDTIITDRERGLYLDPHKLHHINHVGEHFRIRGPQITYRPPQGNVVVIQAEQGDEGEPLDPQLADVLIVHFADHAEAKRRYAQLHAQAAVVNHELRVLQSIVPILGETEAQAQARAAQFELAADNADAPRGQILVGTAASIADQLSAWFAAGSVDGFHFLPDSLPDGLELIVDLLVPELQRRGLFREAYSAATLRGNLGLSRPESRYIGAASEAHTAYFR
jgi:alkanesulfonate monooxygenase SsuD/methylene tetrahydromethanopterin reductase-like flavin-dependent oxidoreductase (luciferase family)